MKDINEGLKDYLVVNDLALFVDFESLIDRDDVCPCQILVLNKPSDIVLELNSSFWKFESKRVALVYNCETTDNFFIPIMFDFLLPGGEKSTKFDFGYFSQIKRNGDQIILTQKCYGDRGYPEYLNVAIFDITGKLLSVWKVDSRYCDQKVNSFRSCGDGRWLVKFESKDFKKTLILLTLGSFEEYNLQLRTKGGQENGHLIDVDINKIKTWFGDKETNPKFFILISLYQFCAYSLQKHEQYERYEMMANIIMAGLIEKIDVVKLDKSFAVNFEVKTSWAGDSNFFLNFEPEVGKK